MFEINDGLSRMYGNIQVRFLGGKGTVKFPTYSTQRLNKLTMKFYIWKERLKWIIKLQ